MSKEELRRLIDAGTEKFKEGKEILRYAAYPAPEKKHPQRKIPNIRAEVYNEFIADLSAGR